MWVLMVVNWVWIALVSVGMTVIKSRAMKAANRTYSMAVAPDGSLRNFMSI